jgi:hypothetical protein
VKSWEVKEKILRPINGKPVYICGEAYSNAQGWVEGALESADLMLENGEYFGLDPLPNPEGCNRTDLSRASHVAGSDRGQQSFYTLCPRCSGLRPRPARFIVRP